MKYWRSYQSGQFLHLDGFVEDWMNQRETLGVAGDWLKGERLTVVSTVCTFTEIFELATRLSMSAAGDEAMHIDIGYTWAPGSSALGRRGEARPFSSSYAASVPEFRYEREYSEGGACRECLVPCTKANHRVVPKV